VKKTILVTGGAGFIGSNFARFLAGKYSGYRVVVLDALTYAGNLENLADLKGNKNFEFVKGDIRDKEIVDRLMKETTAVVHFAAETHVDRSIMNADSFITTDVYGTYLLLEAAKKYGIEKFVHISTDEVYGEAVGKPSLEDDALNPKSPYAASKAGADRLVYSYFTTFNMPVVISRCANNYGPYQYPEKLIPLFASNAMEDKPLPVYGSGNNTRTWIHVVDHCEAIDMLLHCDAKHHGEAFNISSREEFSVLEIADVILKTLGKPASLLKHIQDRPGHVVRHAVDPAKIEKAIGWKSRIGFEKGIEETILWYKNNQSWWKNIKDKQADYKEFQASWYKGS